MFKVLVVEDSLEFQVMLKKILSHHDVTVTDDPDAVERIMSEKKIDLVLLDITLPKRDGYSVLAELQSHPELSSVPVICLTGKNKISDKVTAFSLGADDFVQKPFDPIELKVRIDSKLLKTRRQRSVTEKIACGSLRIDILSHSPVSASRSSSPGEVTSISTRSSTAVCSGPQVSSRGGTTMSSTESVNTVEESGWRPGCRKSSERATCWLAGTR